MTKITSAIVAAVIASASFATAALAEGNYYEGVERSSTSQQAPVTHRDHNGVSYGYTGSIAGSHQQGLDSNGTVVLNRGDYYEGVNRPN